MLSKECFKNNFVGACLAKGITVEPMVQKFIYDAISEEFSDNEFIAITKDVFLNENFYGKLPDISLWTARKRKANSQKEQKTYLEAQQTFQDKVMELCYNGYNTSQSIKEFYAGLTPSEERALNALGGFSAVYSSCRKDGEYSNEKADWTIRRLQDKFKENYNAFSDNSVKISQEVNGDMVKKIEDLTKGMFK